MSFLLHLMIPFKIFNTYHSIWWQSLDYACTSYADELFKQVCSRTNAYFKIGHNGHIRVEYKSYTKLLHVYTSFPNVFFFATDISIRSGQKAITDIIRPGLICPSRYQDNIPPDNIPPRTISPPPPDNIPPGQKPPGKNPPVPISPRTISPRMIYLVKHVLVIYIYIYILIQMF